MTDTWSSVSSIAAANAELAQYAGPGGFNDFDMLEIGNGGLSAAEERAHFGLWAIAKSPLIIGTDLSKISKTSLNVLLNTVSTFSSLARFGSSLAAFLGKEHGTIGDAC